LRRGCRSSPEARFCHFLEELVLRGLAERTQEAYIHQVYHLTKYYRRSPDTLTEEEVHAYLIHLAMERPLSASSINQAVNAFRFFYQHVAHRDLAKLRQAFPFGRKSVVRAQVFSVEQLERLYPTGKPIYAEGVGSGKL
jgi:site-specific recombinase XerD